MDRDANSAHLVAWSGLDLRSGIEGDVKAARAAVREAGWAPIAGRGHRFELLALASRVRPASFLSSLELDAGVATQPDVIWHDDLTVTWSLLYHRVHVTAPVLVVPYAAYVLGVNPPSDLDDAEAAEFTAFYAGVHLPEVAERRGALRASLYELDRELHPPARGAPRFLAVYEVDEDAAQHRNHSGPPYQRGPEVWQKHTTPWRFWYRRLSD